jgi:hypothetical protein
MEPQITQIPVGNIHNVRKTDLLAVSNLVLKHMGVEIFLEGIQYLQEQLNYLGLYRSLFDGEYPQAEGVCK